ncbi:AMP-binding protein [Streptomyces anulatus]|uniref:AMP-binding protein n=1 Tax=Streptomyces anulatus TaxID=1892 RepID=UPI003865F0F7|nr:AMP-binding protein [Streptomyces anulatus]
MSTATFRNYVEDILDGLCATPGREVVVAGDHGDRRVGAEEFRSLVYRLARALEDRGVGPGRAVTLLCGNLPETIAVRYAVNLLGAHYNHLYNRLGADVQAKIVADVETYALIVDPQLAARATQITELVPVEKVLVLGPVPPDGPARGEDLLALAAPQPQSPVKSRARPEDLCMIRHSGGTTGHPKGVRGTFTRMQYTGLLQELFGAARRDLVCTPLSHAGGFLADATLASGGTVVLHDGFDAGEVLATIAREEITHVLLLPPHLYQVLDHPDIETTDTSSLQRITYGSCQSSPVRIAEAVRRFGRVLQQSYGQFEAGAVSVLPAGEHDPDRLDVLRTAGRVIPGVDVEIRTANGTALPYGEVGEICVRGPQVMDGYFKDPELTAEVLQTDGWLHTGDLGRLDAKGYLTVVDRIKDMIAVVGGHVYTTELEDFLHTHPDVRHSAVYGVRDQGRIERIHATVVLVPGSTTTAADLRALVRDGRGELYIPDRIEFVDALPLTDAGKPDKKELRRRAV